MESPAVGEVAETIVGKREILTSDQRVGRYEVIRKIGAGGMGEVFLAKDTELERPVALKVLPQMYAGDDSRVSRFIREARAASALNHPNIITIYEILNFEGSHLIATEFIEGETLRSRQRRQPLALPEIVDVASQISAALSAAHSAGIIHRDIKPENIMIRKDGLVKVLDFGLAKLTEKQEHEFTSTGGGGSLATDPGIVMGTISYMSPEQVRSTADIDSRADIWSLGVVLYESISGRLPFTGGTPSDVIASILRNDPQHLPGGCPPELDRIVAKTLRKERPDRYQTVEDLSSDLKDLERHLENSWPDHLIDRRIPPPTYQSSSITQNLRVQRFSLVHVFSIFAVVAAIFGGSWWYLAAGRQTGTADSQPLKSSDIINWSTSSGEQPSAGTFSPDGKMIAFTSSRAGARSIWIKQIASGEAIQVTKDEFNNQNPVWSPDGSMLAYASNRNDQYGIWQVPAFGGTPKLMATVEEGGAVLHSWSPDNRIYFNLPRTVNLFALDAGTGKTAQVTDLDTAVGIAISPDGSLVASLMPDGDKQAIWITPSAGGEAKQIAAGLAGAKKLTWHPDNKRIFYNKPVDGVFQIFVTGTDGGGARQLTFSDRDSMIMDVSDDGARILYGSAKEESDIWGVDLSDSTEFTVAPDIDAELWANASAAGNKIVYQSVKGLGHGDHIFGAAILTREAKSDAPPLQLAENGFQPAFSPDGRQIAFMQLVNNDYEIETVVAEGGTPRQITSGGVTPSGFSMMPYNRREQYDFSWSPDSRRIAYSSTHGEDLSNIWLAAGDGSGERRVSNNSTAAVIASCPAWSPDGARLAYSNRTQQRGANNNFSYSFMVADTAGASEPKPVFQADSFTRLVGWSQTDDSLVFASGPGDAKINLPPEVKIFQVSLKTGESRQIAILKDAYIYNIALSPDRKQIAYVAHQDGKDNLWVLPASGGGAKKITSNNDSRLYFSGLSWAADGSRIYYGKQMRYSLLSMLNDFK